MNWIERVFASRYVKSIARYLLMALAAYLVQIPLLAPFAEFLKANMGELTELFAGLIIGLVTLWSIRKNNKNAEVEKTIPGVKVK